MAVVPGSFLITKINMSALTKKNFAIARTFVQDKDVICFNKNFYLFNEGVWRLESDENTQSWIITTYHKLYSEPPTLGQVKEIASYISSFTYDEYRKKIKYLSEEHIKNSINTKSGVLDLATLEVTPYKKEDFCFYKLPFDYIKKPKLDVMKKFLDSSMGYDMDTLKPEEFEQYKKLMHFIQEWMGYTLTGGNKLHKALIMVGEGGNGKSTLQDIWEVIVSPFNSSYVDLKFINDGSQLFMTRNKLVNFSKDLESGQQLDTGVTKAFVVSDKIVSNEKYKGQVNMEVTAKLIMSCNELPHIKNAGASVKRRFHILSFDRIFEEHEQDRDLDSKLIAEAEHIFSWAVNGLIRLRKRGSFDPPERCKFGIDEYLKENDSILLWIDENNIAQAGEKTERKLVYPHYKEWCTESGMKPFGKGKFFKRLRTKGFKDDLLKSGYYYFDGLKLPSII